MRELSDDIRAWIVEATAGGTIETVAPMGGGGRTGFGIDVAADGQDLELYLQVGRPEGTGSFLPIAREAEVMRALEPLGIPIPHVWAVDPERGLLLVDRVRGTTWFQAPRDPEEQVSVAQDFIRHLSTWHRADAAQLDLPSFAPVRSIREHQQDQVAEIRAAFEAEDATDPIDALARLELDLLERHLPDDDRQPVLVQGDTGPGNFMYADGKVTAVIDWELAHLGDPMDDIAWLSWRATQHGFPDFPTRLREYEHLSGITVDPQRVYYYRVNAIARLGPRFGLAPMTGSGGPLSGIEPGNERSADGSWFIMSMLHRRMVLTALADLIGMPVPDRAIADEAEPAPHNSMYDGLLGNLSAIVPRIEDQSAARVVKGVARHLKYLKEVDRNGQLFVDQELADINRLLGSSYSTLHEARPALAEAARDEKVAIEDYLTYHFARMHRDDWLMREASGAIFERGWPDLD